MNPARESRNYGTNLEFRDTSPGEAPTMVPSQKHDATPANIPSDLARVMAAWPVLPAPKLPVV